MMRGLKIHQLYCRAFSTPTLKKHPYLVRSDRFSKLEERDIEYFRSLLTAGGNSVITDQETIKTYNQDYTKAYEGQTRLILRPSTTEQVSAILKYCNQRCIAVLPQGGNTGLVGGSVPVFDEIVIQLGGMSRILDFDAISSVLVCEAGCILQTLDDWLRDTHGHCMPLDLGAKGSCQIGGNVATNAGGSRLIRFGSLHGSVLGLEAVLADGTVFKNLGTLRKDNTGYDLKQLFIGSEGTLGIITKVAISTPRAPKSSSCVIFALDSFDKVQKLLALAKEHLSDAISAFEFWDHDSAEMVYRHDPKLKSEFGNLKGQLYVLMETFNYGEEGQDERLLAFIDRTLSSGPDPLCLDGSLAQTETQGKMMWRLREYLPEATSREGTSHVYKYDISLPVPFMYSIVEEMRNELKDSDLGHDVFVVAYGHAGDGNVHLNVIDKRTKERNLDLELQKKIESFVYGFTQDHSGSISAEHGIGLLKADKLHLSKAPEVIKCMKSIKKLFDPNGIMNPYKMLSNK